LGVELLMIKAIAREVVEAAGGDIQSRAVGTGPYRLKEWQRGSRIVLEANPYYRTLSFPESRNPELTKLVSSMKGKKLPAIGRIEFSVIEEQPVRLLEFDRALDFIEARRGGQRFIKNGELDRSRQAWHQAHPYASNSVRPLYVNMEDPVIGGTATTTPPCAGPSRSASTWTAPPSFTTASPRLRADPPYRRHT
jgi:hypothetical protein